MDAKMSTKCVMFTVVLLSINAAYIVLLYVPVSKPYELSKPIVRHLKPMHVMAVRTTCEAAAGLIRDAISSALIPAVDPETRQLCAAPIYFNEYDISGAANLTKVAHLACPCSNQLLAEYFRQHRSLISGFFSVSVHGWPYNIETDTCSFAPALRQKSFRRCLASRIKRMVILGDSNGQRFFWAAQATFLVETQGLTTRCAEVTASELSEAPKYVNVDFFDELNPKNWLYECTYTVKPNGAEHVFLLEYIDVNSVIDPHRPDKLSKQEAILGTFLKNNYPEVVVLMMPFTHESRRGVLLRNESSEAIRANLVEFRRLLHKYVPNSTDVYLLPSHRHHRYLTGTEFHPINYNVRVKGAIDVFIDVFSDDFANPVSKIRTFPNLYELTCPLHAHSYDFRGEPGHFIAEYYQKIIQHVMELACRQRNNTMIL